MNGLVLSVWILTVGVSAARGTSIGCAETGYSLASVCTVGERCTVYCKNSCLSSNDLVYGTELYTLSSSVCRSALHDFRISSWNSSARTVTLIFGSQERKDFAGSLRYGVYSQSWYLPSSFFYFSSPRVKERVLDVTSLHRNYIYDGDTTHTLECHGPPQLAIRFDYSIKEVKLRTVNMSPSPVQGYYAVSFPKAEYPHVRTNMFWCQVLNSPLSTVASPAMFFDAYNSVPFLPRNYTVSASPGDKLTIAVTSLRDGPLTSWTKVDSDGKAKEQISNLGPVMEIPSARLQHGGIYVANGPFTRSPGKNRAIIRVIVRVCRAGLYGPSCNFQCPTCQNGGVCHDITGDCICPPGFRGQLCEQHCGDDYFGQDCSKRCSDTNPDRSVKSCRGILMCRPDPYGCSCGTGFTGFFCNETCPAHHYGADCKQSRLSFCKTEPSCDIHTGTCAKDRGVCLEGWKNSPFCDISYPLLRTKPSVTEVKDTSAIVSFDPWNPSQDYGEGTATDYWIQYRKLNESWDKMVVAAVPRSAPYSRTLRGLRSGETYEVRVLVIDTDKKFRERGAPTTEFRTLCGKPTSPPKNVKVDNSSTHSVIITWQNPGRETWLCWSANVTLEVNGTLVSFNLTESGVNPTDRFVVPTRPFTQLTVRLRLDTPDGASSQWTGPWTVTSAEDAPSEVRQLQMTTSLARQASFAWLSPANANGRIRGYVVVYQPLRLFLPCSPIEQTETRLIVPASSQRVSLEKLHPYTLHRISIHAVTIKPGPNVTTTFTTEQAVPEGAPTGLKHATVTGLENVVHWGQVPCDLANGVVSRYYLELDSADPWESELRNQTTRDMRLGFDDLLPYTRYRARVYAENAAGRSRVAAELNFTTLPTAPPAPSNLMAYQLSQTNVSLSWQPPYPPYGLLDRYQVKFWTSDTRLEPSLLDIDTFRCSRENGDSIRHCFTVPNLLPVRLYHFSVSGDDLDSLLRFTRTGRLL